MADVQSGVVASLPSSNAAKHEQIAAMIAAIPAADVFQFLPIAFLPFEPLYAALNVHQNLLLLRVVHGGNAHSSRQLTNRARQMHQLLIAPTTLPQTGCKARENRCQLHRW